MQGCHVGKDAPQVGWPSINVLRVHGELSKAGINAFGMPSKQLSCIITCDESSVPASSHRGVADKLLGARIWIRCVPCTSHAMCPPCSTLQPTALGTVTISARSCVAQEYLYRTRLLMSWCMRCLVA